MQQRPIRPATRERLAQALLDWFTAGWAAIDMPAANTMRSLALDSLPGSGPASLFGGGQAQALAAAFGNAAISHLREIDDAHRAAMLHPGVVAISPVLALASTLPLSRRQVADAVIAGYEVALRVGEALGTGHAARFHATATAGTVGAGAASATALGLAPAQRHHAMGIAATQAAGLWQLVDDAAHESKSLHPAFAVRNGMMAAFAARAGLPGARAFLTGTRGLYALLSGDGPLSALDAGIEDVGDTSERINTATIKAWPCCAQLFTPLDATRALMDSSPPMNPESIEAIDVVIFPHALKIAGVHWPEKPSETPFCLRYVIATLLRRGGLGIADMENPELNSPALRALADRINVCTDEAFQREFPNRRPSRVTIRLKDGAQMSAYRDLRRGDPEDPFDWRQLQARMRDFAPTMHDATASRLTRWCEAFVDPARDQEACTAPADLFRN